jgi:cytidine deaminase
VESKNLHKLSKYSYPDFESWKTYPVKNDTMPSEKRNIQIQYTVHKPHEEGTMDFAELMQAAGEAMKKAYAPYSGFKVGAAVQLDDEQIILGSNQENAAYPSGLCAERVALFAAASQFPEKKIRAIAIIAENKKGETTPVTPCGSCRQVMLEYEIRQGQPVEIFLHGPDHTILHFSSAGDLLPFGFNNSQLK